MAMGSKVTVENLRRILRNPRVVLGELGWQAMKINRKLSEKDGVRITDRDWDTLVLLDGCRLDTFEKCSRLDGDLSAVQSLGSHSTEFIERNFSDGQYHDTVYVSANPHVESLKGSGIFHDIVDVFDWGWDEELRTVPPETMAEATVDAAEQYPHKRIISHFMQPHTPFIGETGRRITHAGLTGGNREQSMGDSSELSLWMRLRYRLSSEDFETIREAYEENLELALPHVQRIQDAVGGKVVVSADHGNMFGERMRPIPAKMWGHPPGLTHPSLVRVPWLTMPHESRRETRADPPREAAAAMEDSQMNERLRALGYK
ncbi:hypothetical protein [Halorussus aquaticus]|uniref:PglZ domain-containing protein n=1 Tax=Halorussus aquaticus TaxID=2953748 RepID=A0ABD5Q3W3_9EURY|nr:hypothetical protein [Halorussus aquaticus]